jgi:hypothetical protein
VSRPTVRGVVVALSIMLVTWVVLSVVLFGFGSGAGGAGVGEP